MNKKLLLLFIFCNGLTLFGQNSFNTSQLPNKLMIHCDNLIRIGSIGITDRYLSSLSYHGLLLQYENDRRRFFNENRPNLTMQSRTLLSVALLLNMPRNVIMPYAGFEYGWGMHYHFRFKEDMQLLLGGIATVELGAKLLLRNVNNPVNLDFNTQLNFSCLFKYVIKAKNRKLFLQIGVELPVLGMMFIPDYGASYYEILYLEGFGLQHHVFSSWHNRQGAAERISLGIPFNRSTWVFGFYASQLRYKAHNLLFKKNTFAFSMGWKRDIYPIKGKRSLDSSFISPNL